MTTPQNELYNLSEKVRRLTALFEVNREELDIFDNVKEIYIISERLAKRIDNLSDQMAIIIKLLSQKE